MALRSLLRSQASLPLSRSLSLPVTRFASNNLREKPKDGSPLSSFLDALEDYQPERPGYLRSVRKAHVDTPAHFLRHNRPIGKPFNAKARAFVADAACEISEKIEICDPEDDQSLRQIVQEIRQLGEDYGTSQNYWKLWAHFAERFPRIRLNLGQLGISSPESRDALSEFRHQERSAFVSEVIEMFEHTRGVPYAPKFKMCDVKNANRSDFFQIPLRDPQRGLTMNENPDLMLLKWENGAKMMKPVAQTRLANYYLTSYPSIAQWWYRKAEEARFPPAQFRRALCYEFGYAVEKQDLSAALELYKAAATNGHPPAMNNLGALLRTSFPELAFDFFLEAARRGDVDALCNLGVCLLRGQGIPQDLSNGVRLLHIAAEYGHATALYHMGACSALGIGLTVNKSLAVRYWALGAQQDCRECAYNLGMCFFEGFQLPKDHEAAFRWFSHAAEIRHPLALFHKALAYRHGYGVEEDEEAAFKLFHRAAAQLPLLDSNMREQLTTMLSEEDIPVPDTTFQ